MFLSDKDIKAAVDRGEITLSDFDAKRLQPASYDIVLGNKFLLTDGYSTHFIDPERKIFPKTREVIIGDDEEFALHPGVSILGTTKDVIGSRKYLIQLSGKSSLARIGLIVHNTAGIINPGDILNITLELCNLNFVPIILRPGMKIAQLLFAEISSPVSRGYEETGRYYKDNWATIREEKKN